MILWMFIIIIVSDVSDVVVVSVIIVIVKSIIRLVVGDCATHSGWESIHGFCWR